MNAPSDQSAATPIELIAFRIGVQEYCVDIMAVREIRGWSASTPLPRAPHYVRGVINLRGAVLPIVDLSSRLGLGETVTSARSVIVVVRIDTRLVGLLVDAVSDILTVSADTIQPTPDVASAMVQLFSKGILAVEDRMINWLSLDHLLPDQEAVAA
jgi:purine-binding chemotaxis protein CheW